MRFLSSIFIGLVLFQLHGHRNVCAEGARPNILWIYAEDLSPWLGCYGDVVNQGATPHIDSIARQGVLFERAFAPAPVCSATRSALIVGQSAIRFGAHQHRSSRKGTPIYLPDGYDLLPELMQEAGYTTFNYGKADYNFIWDQSAYSVALSSPTDFEALVDQQPFFGQIQTKGGKTNTARFPAERRVSAEEVAVPADYPDDSVFREVVAQHYDAIRSEDDRVGEILEALEAVGLHTNTIVVYFSDHGANRLVRHKQMTTEGGLHVPLVMCGPEAWVPRGVLRSDLVDLLDVSATTLAWAGIDIPCWYEGQDLFSVDFNERSFVGAHKDRLDHTIDRVRSIRSDRFRYVRNYNLDRIVLQPQYRDRHAYLLHLRNLYQSGALSELHRSIYFGARPAEELYEVESDPSMTLNLADHPQFEKELERHRGWLNAWLALGDRGSEEESIETLQVNGENQPWGEGVNPEYERYRSDGDGDGLSDKWEELNGRDPNDGRLIFTFDCGGWQTEGWRSVNLSPHLAGELGTLDFRLVGSSGSMYRNGLAVEMEGGLVALNVLGRSDQDVEIHVLINEHPVGRNTMLKSDVMHLLSIEINSALIDEPIREIELVFKGMSGTRVVLDSIEVGDWQKPKRPNVIYILADDLGYGEVGYNGQELIQTPELDAMAKEGMTFSAHYCGSAVCAPSRCSLMTGLHPGHAYIRSNSPRYPNGQTPLPKDTETVATLAKRAGYTTAIIGKWGLGGVLEDVVNPVVNSGHPNHQGFDHFFGYLDQRKAHNYYPDHLWRNRELVKLENSSNGWDPANRDYSHDRMTEEAIKWITTNKEEPLFLYLAYCVPHTWWQVPDLGMYEDEDWPEQHLQIQAAMVSRMDRDIGRIKRLLETLGLAENTLILFNSDNGAHGQGLTREFFDTTAGLNGKKRMMTEGGVRSPMLAYWPGTIKAGTTSDHLSAFWDFLPTMAELTGEPIRGETDGISMVPELLGLKEQQAKHAYLYWELYEGRPNCGVRMDHWKGIVKDRRNGMKIELYDLRVDEVEQVNVAEAYPLIVSQIRSIMEEAHQPNPYWDKEHTPLFNAAKACSVSGVIPEPLKQK
jgi:arylsulfatase A-like enzyme